MTADLIVVGKTDFAAVNSLVEMYLKRINFYLNHMGVSVSVNGRKLMENRLMREGVRVNLCGRTWDYMVSPGVTPDDLIEIHLRSGPM